MRNLFEHLEDHVAAVSAGELRNPGMRYRRWLLVNGIGMTMRTTDTKMLAHLPAVLHPEGRRALVLCFGMGTAFRSSLAHPYERVDSVELVPSVPGLMRHYHADAEAVLADPRGRVVIDDGRGMPGDLTPPPGQGCTFSGSLREVLCLLSHLDVLVCNEGGIMHAAAALDVPVVVPFGPTSRHWFSPCGRGHQVVSDPAITCGPCTHRCRRGFAPPPPCLTNVTAERESDALKACLAG